MDVSDLWAALHMLISMLGAMVGWLLGDQDLFLYSLIAFVVLDYITGVLGAIIRKNLSSSIGAKGICKKLLIFIVVSVGHLVDLQLGQGSVLRTAILFFYISNEGISILENAIALGLPVPEKLRNILAQLKNNR